MLLKGKYSSGTGNNIFSPLEGAPSFIHQDVPIAPAHWEILNHVFKQLIVGSADICETH